MGPAVLLCPSSAVQLFGQASPSKTTRQKVYSSPNERGRRLFYAHWRGDFFRRSTHFWPNIAAKSRNRNALFSWRVFSAAVGEEVSVEEPVAETTVELESAQTEELLKGATGGEGTDSSGLKTLPQAEQPLKGAINGEGTDSSGLKTLPQAEQPLKGATNGEGTDSSGLKTQRRRPRRESRNIVVQTADLLPGATFTGKVTTIQSFGAFVDIGAFTNGLVHISRLSKSFVKTVEDVVQVGQEVNVQILDVDLQAKRISLMLKQEEQQEEQESGNRSARSSDREGSDVQQGVRGARRGDSQRRDAASPASTKLKKGETATGVVKNVINSGVFVTLSDGVDGFLPATETNLRGANVNVNLETQFKLGQEVTVRVLRTERGRVRLTMKQQVDMAKINESLNKELVGGATNPFEIAFRQNSVISSYLEEKQKLQDVAEGKVVEAEPEAAVKDVSDEESSSTSPEEDVTEVPSDDKTVDSVSGSLLEEADDDERNRENVASQEPLEELVDEMQESSQDPIADEGADEKIAKSAESVDEADLVKQASVEGVQAAVQEAAPVEQVLAGKEAAIEGMMAAVQEVLTGTEGVVDAVEEAATPAEKTVAPVEDPLVIGGSATNEAMAAIEGVLAPAEDASAIREATADEVVGDLKDAVAPVEKATAVEDSVAGAEKELAEHEVAVPEPAAPKGEAAGAPEEVVKHVEGVVAVVEEALALVEEAVAVVENELAKQEIAVQDPVPPAEEVFATGEAAGEELVGDMEVAEAAVEKVVVAVMEELAEQATVQEGKPLISKEEEIDVPLEAEKAPLEKEAALQGTQEKVDQVHKKELAPASQHPKVNAVEEPAVEVKEASQESAEMEALEVVGVNKQDN